LRLGAIFFKFAQGSKDTGAKIGNTASTQGLIRVQGYVYHRKACSRVYLVLLIYYCHIPHKRPNFDFSKGPDILTVCSWNWTSQHNNRHEHAKVQNSKFYEAPKVAIVDFAVIFNLRKNTIHMYILYTQTYYNTIF